MFDTTKNRQTMPLEDFSKWVNLEGTSELLLHWANGNNRPKSGSFLGLKTKEGVVIPEFL